MNAISQITASRDVCETLVKLGITSQAFFYHSKEVQKRKGESDIITWDVWEFESGCQAYKPDEVVPAWTKQELDVMLGGDIPKPDLPELKNTKVVTTGFGKDQKTVFVYEYVYYTIKTMMTWGKTSIIHNPGPYASAKILLMALQYEWTTAAAANERYNAIFKH